MGRIVSAPVVGVKRCWAVTCDCSGFRQRFFHHARPFVVEEGTSVHARPAWEEDYTAGHEGPCHLVRNRAQTLSAPHETGHVHSRYGVHRGLCNRLGHARCELRVALVPPEIVLESLFCDT